jgi:hypothetical protein
LLLLAPGYETIRGSHGAPPLALMSSAKHIRAECPDGYFLSGAVAPREVQSAATESEVGD